MNKNNPLCTSNALSAQVFAAARHVTVSRRGLLSGLVDLALAKQGLSRHVAVVTYSFAEAMVITRETDLIATVPTLLTQPMQQGVCCYPLPLDTPSITISQAWHPRFQSDPEHQFLRQMIYQYCQVHFSQ